ncbi:TPA: restriction endonuclease subunit S [Acinetobacter baumannii]|nr:restriction endonuclease subunit S [Acinetobacter baumannii]
MALDDLDENKAYINYISYYLKYRGLADVISGSAQPQITREGLQSVKIPLPPLEEQRRIASILDQADELRQKRQQAIEKLDQLLQATFIDMFGDPVSNPNNYEQVELDNFILVGPQNGLYKPANMYGQGTPIVRIDGFKSGDIIDNKEFKRLSLEESDIEKYKLNKFDLVINRVNSPEYIGKTALIRNLEESTVFESNMMRFAVDTSKLDTYYLLFFLKQQFVLNQIANKRKDAVNQSSINQQDVKSLIINVPPIELQITFSNFFQKLEKNRNLFNQQALNFDNLFKALQNQAFNGTL